MKLRDMVYIFSIRSCKSKMFVVGLLYVFIGLLFISYYCRLFSFFVGKYLFMLAAFLVNGLTLCVVANAVVLND